MSVLAAVRELNRHDRLTKQAFDVIVSKHGVDPDTDELVSLLIDDGWIHTPHADMLGYEYLREVPETPPWNRFTAVLREI